MLPILVTLSLILLPKSCEEKEPEDEQLCIAVHTINNNICDANPYTIQVIKHSLSSTALYNTMYMTQRSEFTLKQNKLLVRHKLSPSHQHWLHQVWRKMFSNNIILLLWKIVLNNIIIMARDVSELFCWGSMT